MRKKKEPLVENDGDIEEKKENVSLKEMFNELDSLIEKMEGEESLEKTFEMYKRGVKLLKEAGESLDYIEKQVKILDGTVLEEEDL